MKRKDKNLLVFVGLAAIAAGGYYVWQQKKAKPKALPKASDAELETLMRDSINEPLSDLESPDLGAYLADVLFG